MKWFHEKRIVVPFDFSDESLGAVEVAQKLASNPRDVHVLHVLPNLSAAEPGVVWDTVSDDKRKQHTLAAMRKKLAGLISEDVQLNVGFGDPGYVIADLAEEIGAGLLVVPSHGRTGLKRLLLGSVAERVVRLAKCPVLVLKHKSDDES